MTIIDWLLVAILVYSTVISWFKGFVREVFVLISVVTGLLLAAWFYSSFAGFFKDLVRTENLALFFAFTVIFVATLIVGFVVIWLIGRFIKFAKLQWADRMLGAAFGFIRGWVIGGVLLLALTAFDVQTERLKNSRLVPYFLPGSRVIAVMTPYEVKAKFLVGYRTLERWWRQN